jgi:hypothetical protein
MLNIHIISSIVGIGNYNLFLGCNQGSKKKSGILWGWEIKYQNILKMNGSNQGSKPIKVGLGNSRF